MLAGRENEGVCLEKCIARAIHSPQKSFHSIYSTENCVYGGYIKSLSVGLARYFPGASCSPPALHSLSATTFFRHTLFPTSSTFATFAPAHVRRLRLGRYHFSIKVSETFLPISIFFSLLLVLYSNVFYLF